MDLSDKPRRPVAVIALLIVVAVGLSACGSQGGGGTGNTGVRVSVASEVKQTGPGLTEPTTGQGARIKGGTVMFAEAAGTPPNYIFPMYSTEYCNNNDIGELDEMLYRPLYWFGDHYSPKVDFDRSVGQPPIFSDDDKTVTIHLNHYKWSDGETVSARDIIFWINVMEADPAKEWCNFVPGRFPQNLTSYKAVNATTVRLTLNRSYNKTWFLYDELSQIIPIPMAWDRTSLAQAAPNPDAAGLPDTTKAGAMSVYDFLNTQSQKLSSWGSSPLWGVVDGPWKVASTTSNGGVTFVPNRSYSGSPKPSLSKFIEVPFTSESAMINQIKSQGTSALTVAYIPSQYQPLTASLERQGYDVNMATSESFAYFPLNLHAPRIGKVFQQLYARQALQHLIDQNAWIKHFLQGAAIPTYGPVPLAPANPFVSAQDEPDLYPFSVATAGKLLREHGWKVVPGGQSSCEKPGTGPGDCGAGVTKGQPFEFNLDYVSDTTSVAEEMEDLQSQASKVGIKIDLTTHPFDDIESPHCDTGQPDCNWTAENWGGGWEYTFYPSGESLSASDSVSNYSNYSSPVMDRLIGETITAPTAAQERVALSAYVKFSGRQLAAGLYVPQTVGVYSGPSAGMLISRKLGGFTVNTGSSLTPEDWYLTK